MTTTGSLIEYEAALFSNRRVFLLNHGWAFFAYRGLHETFTSLGNVLSQGRDKDGHSHVGLIPFFLIMQRQAANAFFSLASLQSFQAWVLVRPCLEACLMSGKWMDNPQNAVIWRNRQADPKTYRKTYQGKALQSTSLPRSDQIQGVLRVINDDFLHTNSKYFDRHMEMDELDKENVYMQLRYFDPEADYVAHTFAFLHLTAVIQDSLSEMLAAIIVDQPRVPPTMAKLEETLTARVTTFLSSNPERVGVLEELGLWDLT